MNEIAVRVLALPERKKVESRVSDWPSYDTIFSFDTETTNDAFFNLKFGSFAHCSKEGLKKIGLFYDKEFVSEKELNELKSYCEKDPIFGLLERKDYIEKVFYPLVYRKKTLCVGFNLPFDISRLCKDFKDPKTGKTDNGWGYAEKSMANGFTFHLSEKRKFPPINVKQINTNQSFIRFQATSYPDNQSPPFGGFFTDTKTLGYALTGERNLSLEILSNRFNKEFKKLKAKEHGKITQEYIDYNLTDTLATAELFFRLKEEFDKYEIQLPLNEVYSPASLVKGIYHQLNIQPFAELNPKYFQELFFAELLGKVFMGYFSGRTECMVRKEPTKVTVLDFNSAYPTAFILSNLWKFLIAERIECYDNTAEARELLEKTTIDDWQNQENWPKLNSLVEIIPDNDILPVRADYSELGKNEDLPLSSSKNKQRPKKSTFTVGQNFLSCDKELPVPLADAFTSKLRTGKSPKIVRAIKFVPVGIQKGLKKTRILGNEIDPTKDLFKFFVEKKEELKKLNDDRYKCLKLLCNAGTYGNFVELNRDERKDWVDVYADHKFSCIQRLERPGKWFNPILAIFTTAATRLMLGIVESILLKHGESHSYCDTDSMMIPVHREKEILDWFKPLNPYQNVDSILKVVERGIWFYGISSKRYCLYTIENGDFIIKDDASEKNFSLHGLTFTNPFDSKVKDWQKNLWRDILRLHYGKISIEDLLENYSDRYVIYKCTLSKKRLMERFKKFNEGNDFAHKVKPFSFFHVGLGVNGIKPLVPFSRNPQEAVHKPFFDLYTGKKLQGTQYWKTVDDEIWDFINHRETKFKGDTGLLQRRHITSEKLVFIGKEANDIEEDESALPIENMIYEDQKVKDYERKKRLRGMTLLEARMRGIKTNTWIAIQKRIDEDSPVIIRKKTEAKLEGVI